MLDYPQDGEGQMLEVHNGEKMLLDLPEDVTTPTVHVDDKIYYVGELLQRNTGAYFIPERFFTRKRHDGAPEMGVDELCSLGYRAVRSEVRISLLVVFLSLTNIT